MFANSGGRATSVAQYTLGWPLNPSWTALPIGQGNPQIPERSGLPSSVLGAGAARLGFPSGNRGIPEVGEFSHCAERGEEITQTISPTAIRIWTQFYSF